MVNMRGKHEHGLRPRAGMPQSIFHLDQLTCKKTESVVDESESIDYSELCE